MTQTERFTQVFTATVKTKAEQEDGFVLELDIPDFKSQYPTKITRVDPSLAAELKPGQTYRLVFERQNLKKDKSGEKYYDYYWGLFRLADATEGPGTPAPTTNGTAPSGDYVERRDQHIRRQLSLTAAIQLHAQGITGVDILGVLEDAAMIQEWVEDRTGMPPAVIVQEWGGNPQAAPEAPEQGPDAAAEELFPPEGEEPKKRPQDEVVRNLGDLWTAAQGHYGLTKTQALRLTGYSRQEDIPDVADAWAQIIDSQEEQS